MLGVGGKASLCDLPNEERSTMATIEIQVPDDLPEDCVEILATCLQRQADEKLSHTFSQINNDVFNRLRACRAQGVGHGPVLTDAERLALAFGYSTGHAAESFAAMFAIDEPGEVTNAF